MCSYFYARNVLFSKICHCQKKCTKVKKLGKVQFLFVLFQCCVAKVSVKVKITGELPPLIEYEVVFFFLAVTGNETDLLLWKLSDLRRHQKGQIYRMA